MNRDILLFFCYLIEAVVLWQYSSSLFKPVRHLHFRLILLVVFYIVLFLFSLLKISALNIVLFLLLNMLYLFTQFQLQFRSVFFHSAMLTALMGISELLAFGIISRFAPNFVAEEHTGLLIFSLFSKTFYFATMYLLSHIFKTQNTPYEVNDRSNIILILIPLSSIFIMFTFLHIGEKVYYVYPQNILVTTSSIFLLLMNFLVFGIHHYNQKKQAEFIEMQLLLQKESDSAEYYEMLLAQTENQNILIHDIKKHLQSIALLNAQKESDKLNDYVNQLMDSSDLKESARICDNEMLNAILSRYQRQCQQKHIHFIADIRSGVLQNMYHHELTALFCNLLDNAIEATKNIPDAFIEISVRKKENLPFVMIVVINSCRTAPTYDHNHLPISNKSDSTKHGYGIKSIKKVVKHFHGDLQMYYDDSNATFHTIITLKA